MNEREMFKAACFGEPIEISDQKQAMLWEQWIISRTCRGCGGKLEKGDFVIGQTYWGGLWAGSHAACKGWVAEEAYECQVIDADCNDCKHFMRGEKLWAGIFEGKCVKTGETVRAYPNFCSGHACFEHRRVYEQV